METAQIKTVAEKAMKDLTALGRVWARYGLTVGKAALETGATQLQKTATRLGEMSEKIRPEAKAEEAPPQQGSTAEPPAAPAVEVPKAE